MTNLSVFSANKKKHDYNKIYDNKRTLCHHVRQQILNPKKSEFTAGNERRLMLLHAVF